MNLKAGEGQMEGLLINLCRVYLASLGEGYIPEDLGGNVVPASIPGWHGVGGEDDSNGKLNREKSWF